MKFSNTAINPPQRYISILYNSNTALRPGGFALLREKKSLGCSLRRQMISLAPAPEFPASIPCPNERELLQASEITG
jgi:hypothetical protein